LQAILLQAGTANLKPQQGVRRHSASRGAKTPAAEPARAPMA
jgi:hypothetical protein